MAQMFLTSLQHGGYRDQDLLIGSVSFNFGAKLGGFDSLPTRLVLTQNSPRHIEAQSIPSIPLPVSPTGNFFLNRIQCKDLVPSYPQSSAQQLPVSTTVVTTISRRLQLQCPFAKCPKKFERASDLQRHGEIFHIKHPCFVRGCSRNEHGFCRREKLNEHLREIHPDFFTPPKSELEQLPISHQISNGIERPKESKKSYVSTKSSSKLQHLRSSKRRQKALLSKAVEVKNSTKRQPNHGRRQKTKTVEVVQRPAADANNIGFDERPSQDFCDDFSRDIATEVAGDSMKESLISPNTHHLPFSPIAERGEWSETDSETESTLDGSDFYNCLLGNHNQFLAGDLKFPISESSRQVLIERAMDEFWMVFNHEWSPCLIQCAGSMPSSPSEVRRQSTTTASSPNEQTRYKRKNDEDDDDTFERGDGDGQGNIPRKKKSKINRAKRNFRFACPFRKHNPTKYNVIDHRLCALNPWENVARLKEHLYRKHMAAPYCGRCWQVFENLDLLSRHVNLPRADVCEATEGCPPEGITPEQERTLRRKRKSYADQSEESRWREIYRTLFTGDLVPLPHFDPPREQITTTPNSHSLDQYESYMREQLPELIRSRIEQYLDASVFRSLDFGAMIRECQEELSRTYREAATEKGTDQLLPSDPGQSEQNTASPATALEISGSSSDRNLEFVSEVLRIPPPQPDSQVLDPSSVASIRDSKVQPSVDQFSDSGYAGKDLCTCTGNSHCQSTSQENTADIDKRNRPETLANHFSTALSLQVASREAMKSTLGTTSHTSNHSSQPFVQPVTGVFDVSTLSHEHAGEKRSNAPNTTPTLPPNEVHTTFETRPDYQYQPEIITVPLFQSTGFPFAPTPIQHNNDTMFANPEDNWQEAIEFGLFVFPPPTNF